MDSRYIYLSDAHFLSSLASQSISKEIIDILFIISAVGVTLREKQQLDLVTSFRR